MSFYASPEAMYSARADNYRKCGNAHWAMAKSGYGDEHFGIARKAYDKARENEEKAKAAANDHATW